MYNPAIEAALSFLALYFQSSATLRNPKPRKHAFSSLQSAPLSKPTLSTYLTMSLKSSAIYLFQQLTKLGTMPVLRYSSDMFMLISNSIPRILDERPSVFTLKMTKNVCICRSRVTKCDIYGHLVHPIVTSSSSDFKVPNLGLNITNFTPGLFLGCTFWIGQIVQHGTV